MDKTPRKALGFKRPAPKQDVGSEPKRPAKQDEKADEIKARREEKRLARKNVILKHAPTILDLAEKALAALQALIAAESVAKDEFGCEECMLFSSDEITLEEATHAVSITRFSAREAIQAIEKKDE